MAKRTLGVYRTYNFRTKDPIIDVVRTAVQDSAKTYGDVSDASGVSRGTLANWFGGKTMRPQFCTVMAVLRSCGVDLKQTPYSLRNGRKS